VCHNNVTGKKKQSNKHCEWFKKTWCECFTLECLTISLIIHNVQIVIHYFTSWIQDFVHLSFHMKKLKNMDHVDEFGLSDKGSKNSSSSFNNIYRLDKCQI